MPSGKKYDNAELYAGVTSGPFNAKVSYALTDYFGLNGETAPYAYSSALPDRGSSKGTVYMELNYTCDLGASLATGSRSARTPATRWCATTASFRTPT